MGFRSCSACPRASSLLASARRASASALPARGLAAAPERRQHAQADGHHRHDRSHGDPTPSSPSIREAGHGLHERFFERRQLTRVVAPPRQVVDVGSAGPEQILAAAALVPEVRGLTELVSELSPVRVLRLPPHQPWPVGQEGFVNDLDPSACWGPARRRSALASGASYSVNSREATSASSTPSAAGTVLREDRQQLRPAPRRPRALRRRQVAEQLSHDRLPPRPQPLQRGLRVLGQRSGHSRRSARRPRASAAGAPGPAPPTGATRQRPIAAAHPAPPTLPPSSPRPAPRPRSAPPAGPPAPAAPA